VRDKVRHHSLCDHDPLAFGFATPLYGILEFDRQKDAFVRFDIAAPGEVCGRWGDANEFDKYVTQTQRLEFLAALVREAELIDVVDVVTECRDPKDNKFLELALSGRGSHVVTGDSDLRALRPFREIAIVTPQSFLTMLGVQNRSAEPSDEPDRNMPGELS
jgi:hypothetical protein